MALLQYTEAYSTPYVVLGESKEAPGYTDAVRRDLYEHHAIQCTTSPITVQISLVYEPSETDESDWFDYGTGTYIHIDAPAVWVRAKGVGAKDVAHIFSVRPSK